MYKSDFYKSFPPFVFWGWKGEEQSHHLLLIFHPNKHSIYRLPSPKILSKSLQKFNLYSLILQPLFSRMGFSYTHLVKIDSLNVPNCLLT